MHQWTNSQQIRHLHRIVPPDPHRSLHPNTAFLTVSTLQGPDSLTVTTLPNPQPSPTQYLILIRATAANFFDLLQIRGKYQHQPPFPWISGSEFSGIVLSTPSNLLNRRFQPGDRVFGAALGGYATHIACAEDQLRPVPKGWSFEDAVGLMVTTPTSYAALVTRAGVRKGDWVLIHAAAGGVGLAAVQVAKAGSERKLEIAEGFGADHVLNYNQKGWEDEVKRLSPGGKGVDIVFDPVGLVNTSLKCTAWNEKVIVVGFAAGSIEKVAMNRVLLKNVSLVGLHWGMYAKEQPETNDEVWRGLFDLIEEGHFKGTVFSDKKYVGLDRVPSALKNLGNRETWGKVVVKVREGGEGKL